MQKNRFRFIKVEKKVINSRFLSREVRLDVYLPKENKDLSEWSLLLLNDGQDLPKMDFAKMVDELLTTRSVSPLCCVGIYAGDRFAEFGTAGILDFDGRGAKADRYHLFLLEELLPFLHEYYDMEQFHSKAIAGFSLGGLSAIDVAWTYPYVFSIAGIFSGSLWWRTKDLGDGYNDETDRIIHQKIKKGKFAPGLRFYFTTGSLDETSDRNNNGIIDSIDDTLDLIKELKKKGYAEKDICYINYEDGKHDVESWGKAMPQFLLWGWAKDNNKKGSE